MSLIAMGEALIDFMPKQIGVPLRHVTDFQPAVGGAPANVCGAFAKLGGTAKMITQLGCDHFGDKIAETLQENGIGCEYILRTSQANTSLSFVALKEDGKREFSFFRNPGADMLYPAEAVQKAWFETAYCFHFCSVSLGDFPMKEAHKRAISYAREAGVLVSFDPNLRPALWDNEETMIQTVREFLPYVDVLKVSDEELEQITGEKDEEAGLNALLQAGVKLLIYTKGADGAMAVCKAATASVPGILVKAVDTTGAGDGFIGAFLFQLWRNQVTRETLEQLSEVQLRAYLTFANRFCSLSVQSKGAIVSYPTMEEMEK